MPNGFYADSSEATSSVSTTAEEAAPYGLTEDTHTRPEGSIKTANLEDYILLAERICLPRYPRQQIFRRAPHVQSPTLRSDRENRVLVFPGSFNPPHLGHAALLWHTYLCLDDKTIAAMILPMRTASASASKKKLTKAANPRDGRAFKLSSHQRAQLWQDEVLSRFIWVWPADGCEGSSAFLRCMQKLTEADGFKLAFPSLHGGDHFKRFRPGGDLGWGTGSVVTSDMGRRVDFIKEPIENVTLPDCKKWKMMRASKSECTGNNATGRPCWPCKKLRSVCAEFFETTNGEYLEEAKN